MTERKPSGVSWESWVERQIREAQDRGDFDGLPGSGKPIADLHEPRDDNWWVKKKLEHERIAALPPALAIRHDRDETMRRITEARSEREVRDLLEALNLRIRRVNSTVTVGPSTTVGVLDVDAVVEAWRRGHDTAGSAGSGRATVPGEPRISRPARR